MPSKQAGGYKVRIVNSQVAWRIGVSLRCDGVVLPFRLPDVPSGNLDCRLETMRKAGFGRPGTETEEEKKSNVTLKPWPLNALRHSFGSYWLAKFKDTAALALQMGNSPQIIFAHYRELVSPDDAKQFWSMKPELSTDAD